MKRIIVSVFMLFVMYMSVFGDEDQPVYSFGDITVQVEGWARESFIRSFLSIREDRKFPDLESLADYLRVKEQKLINKRLFAEAKISYLMRESDPFVADVLIYVKDGAPVFGLPFYKYNSNYGHQFGAVAYFYDAFGTLTNILLSGGYSATSFDDDPFRKVFWDVSLEWDKIDFFNTSWNMKLRREYKTKEKINYDTDVIEEFYHYNEMELSFRTGATFYEVLRYSFRPSFSWEYGYDVNDESDPVDTSTKLSNSLTHSLGFGNINWNGNYRRGYRAGISQKIGYDYFNRSFDNVLGIGFTGFAPWWIFQLGTSASLSYNIVQDSIATGGNLRGILDSRVSGQFVYTQNFDVSTKLFTIPRIADIHGGSFIDVGLMKLEDESFQSPYLTAGIEGLFFPLPFKSLIIRGTFGFDVRALMKGDLSKWELIIAQTLSY